MRNWIAAFVVMLVSGCDTGPERYSATGRWEGVEYKGTVRHTLILIEEDGEITGTGTLTGPGGSSPVTVEGTNRANAIDLVVETESSPTRQFAGRITSRSRMEGLLTWLGHSTPMTLTRQ